MSHGLKIFKNSMFLTIQPLIMNFISLFVIGYMARKLGTSDFGVFNFALEFIMIFYPLAVIGLNRITVREMAGMEEQQEYASKMLTLRSITAFLAFITIIVSVVLLGYEPRMRDAIIFAAFIFLFQLVSEAFTDIFNANEKMEYTALTNFIMGISLTLLSVVVLFMGYGLFEVIGTYVFGNLLGFLLGWIILVKFFFKPRPHFDIRFSWEKLLSGSSFFFMTMMWFFIMRFDLIILSKVKDASVLGIYTAGILLITKLTIIPQGLSNAILPTASKLYATQEFNDLRKILDRLFTLLIAFSIPFAIGVSFFGVEIMTLIFGEKFIDAGNVFSLAIWAFPARCISFVAFAVLTAMAEQNQLLKSYVIATIYCIVANLILTVKYGMMGALACYVSTQVLLLLLFSYYLVRKIDYIFNFSAILKIFLSSFFMLLILSLLKDFNLFSSILSSAGISASLIERCAKLDFILNLVIGFTAYIVFVFGFRVYPVRDIHNLIRLRFS